VSRFLDVDLSDAAEVDRAAAAAAEALRAGELVVFPTETVYGIACRPDDPVATARLFDAKRRPRGLNLPVLAAATEDALALGEAREDAVALAAALWPGPLTIVLRRSAASAAWDLGDEPETIGVRVPDLPLTRAVLARTGPLGVTSANRSGEPPAGDRDALVGAFGDSVALYLVAPRNAPEGTPSTVIDLSDAPRARLLRAGSVSRERVDEVLGSSGRRPQWVDSPS
jgi:tRNA threonylcarbamoyl adenosine modification protein (Sua5/YciO/YrdC/YwlC family)